MSYPSTMGSACRKRHGVTRGFTTNVAEPLSPPQRRPASSRIAIGAKGEVQPFEVG